VNREGGNKVKKDNTVYIVIQQRSDQRSRTLEAGTVCCYLKSCRRILILPFRHPLRTSGPQLRRASSSSKRGISSFLAVL
jgi:hypothetical protein